MIRTGDVVKIRRSFFSINSVTAEMRYLKNVTFEVQEMCPSMTRHSICGQGTFVIKDRLGRIFTFNQKWLIFLKRPSIKSPFAHLTLEQKIAEALKLVMLLERNSAKREHNDPTPRQKDSFFADYRREVNK